MEYELYIDVLFLENFMMDYLLLLLVRQVIRCPSGCGRAALGALAGSLLFCVTVVMPVPVPAVKFILLYVVSAVLMVRTGLAVTGGKQLAAAFGILYGAGFLAGGIMIHLSLYTGLVEVGSLFFALAVASYFTASGILGLINLTLGHTRYRCRADLYQDGKKVTLLAVIDTGNSLRDPLTGEPVSILDPSAAAELLGRSLPARIRYIPYRSVGCAEGLLPAVRLDRLCIHEHGSRWIEKPLVGISAERISEDGTYRMILHPDL